MRNFLPKKCAVLLLNHETLYVKVQFFGINKISTDKLAAGKVLNATVAKFLTFNRQIEYSMKPEFQPTVKEIY